MREIWLSDQGKNAEAEQILPGVFATRQRVLGSAPTLNIANFNAKRPILPMVANLRRAADQDWRQRRRTGCSRFHLTSAAGGIATTIYDDGRELSLKAGVCARAPGVCCSVLRVKEPPGVGGPLPMALSRAEDSSFKTRNAEADHSPSVVRLRLPSLCTLAAVASIPRRMAAALAL